MRLDRIKFDGGELPYVEYKIKATGKIEKRRVMEKSCIVCGKSFYVTMCNIRRGMGKFCSPKCFAHELKTRTGEKSARWRGGRLNDKGYIQIYMPGANKTGYVMEHRIVMQSQLKRVLGKNEVVHHINGNRSDNRIENLQAMSIGDHVRLHKMQMSTPE